MFIGYMRVSKSDGSQTLDLQRDALVAAGVAPARLYEDFASGRHDSRPGLQACPHDPGGSPPSMKRGTGSSPSFGHC